MSELGVETEQTNFEELREAVRAVKEEIGQVGEDQFIDDRIKEANEPLDIKDGDNAITAISKGVGAAFGEYVYTMVEPRVMKAAGVSKEGQEKYLKALEEHDPKRKEALDYVREKVQLPRTK